jgi:hypothetical protein
MWQWKRIDEYVRLRLSEAEVHLDLAEEYAEKHRKFFWKY